MSEKNDTSGEFAGPVDMDQVDAVIQKGMAGEHEKNLKAPKAFDVAAGHYVEDVSPDKADDHLKE